MHASITQLAKLLVSQHLKLITIESCTGGLLGAKCTDVAGSSRWFEAGFITYSDQAKQTFVGVETKLLDCFGAVSKEVAIAMAKGGLEKFPQTISVSITGIAGPDGATATKPVGRVYIALAAMGVHQVKEFDFKGDRQQVRQQSCQMAIQLLIKRLEMSS